MRSRVESPNLEQIGKLKEHFNVGHIFIIIHRSHLLKN